MYSTSPWPENNRASILSNTSISTCSAHTNTQTNAHTQDKKIQPSSLIMPHQFYQVHFMSTYCSCTEEVSFSSSQTSNIPTSNHTPITHPLEVPVDSLLALDHVVEERQRSLAEVARLEERQLEEGVDEVGDELTFHLLQLVPHEDHQLPRHQPQVSEPEGAGRGEEGEGENKDEQIVNTAVAEDRTRKLTQGRPQKKK